MVFMNWWLWRWLLATVDRLADGKKNKRQQSHGRGKPLIPLLHLQSCLHLDDIHHVCVDTDHCPSQTCAHICHKRTGVQFNRHFREAPNAYANHILSLDWRHGRTSSSPVLKLFLNLSLNPTQILNVYWFAPLIFPRIIHRSFCVDVALALMISAPVSCHSRFGGFAGWFGFVATKVTADKVKMMCG